MSGQDGQSERGGGGAGSDGREGLIPKHDGYRKLKSFQIAQLVYDVTVRFCDRYIDKRSRTHDQMVQAARSGVQNIAEGSKASGTSKKMELKPTNVARASLEELRLDYEDFLRHRGLEIPPPDHPILLRFKERRCASLQEVREWVAEEQARQQNPDRHRLTRMNTDKASEKRSVSVGESQCKSMPTSALVANAALSLLNLACHFLDRQLAAQAEAFEKEGGFTERLYQRRINTRRTR
jgi:four helix bundle suffix protein